MKPSRDPNSTKYADSGRTFYRGAWRTPEQIELTKEAEARYAQTEKGRATRAAANARYQMTEKGRASRAAATARYQKTEKGRANVARKNKRNNPKILRLGRVYLGTENQFPAPREAVLAFARGLREEHLGTHE